VRGSGRNLYLSVDVLVVGLLGMERRMGNLIMKVKGGVVRLKMVVKSRDL
jgi:hypothetical protein